MNTDELLREADDWAAAECQMDHWQKSKADTLAGRLAARIRALEAENKAWQDAFAKHDARFHPRIQAAEARVETLKEALREIARQKTTLEAEEEGDLAYGYDQCVMTARAALAEADKPTVTSVDLGKPGGDHTATVETKFTPGKRQAYVAPNSGRWVVDTTDGLLCGDFGVATNPYSAGNAHLDAAAPDLYAALEMISTEWAGHSEACAHYKYRHNDCDCDWPKIQSQCEAALAKARGES